MKLFRRKPQGVLSKAEILRYIDDRKLIFEPALAPSQIDQVSVDLRLGRNFTRFKELPGYVDAIRVDKSLFAADHLWEETVADDYVLKPQGFVLAQTLERVVIPEDLVGLVEGRSSWARTGVSIHLTAPKIDPGFDGTIALEMANVGTAPVRLVAIEDTPAQLMFLTLSSPLRQAELYGKEEEDIFQYQADPRGRTRPP